jgi:hypothetical protein
MVIRMLLNSLVANQLIFDQLLYPKYNSFIFNICAVRFDRSLAEMGGRGKRPVRAKPFNCNELVSREGIEPPTY